MLNSFAAAPIAIPLAIRCKIKAKAAARAAGGPEAAATRALPVLQRCVGRLAAGTSTLLLAPPGHGKSSLLRALAGHLAADKLVGSLTYSGVPAAQLAAKGIKLSLLAAYVDQVDNHLPFLTVRETIAFANALANVSPELMGHSLLVEAAATRTERVLRLLHLEGCADTLVGNAAVRGVSGGERKRVSVAEALVSNARLVCLDEISTGLDASIMYDIVSCINSWAHTMKSTVCISLQQPTPEVFGLFDELILLREGSTVFHGPISGVRSHFCSLGFAAPGRSAGDVSQERTVDLADWLIDLLTSPTAVLRRQGIKSQSNLGDTKACCLSRPTAPIAAAAPAPPWGPASRPRTTPGPNAQLAAALPPQGAYGGAPRTTAALSAAWVESEAFKQAAGPLLVVVGEGKEAKPSIAAGEGSSLELNSAFAKKQYGSQYPRSAGAALVALVFRAKTLVSRNKVVVGARLFAAVIISIILGMVWYNLTISQWGAKLGLFVFALAQASARPLPPRHAAQAPPLRTRGAAS